MRGTWALAATLASLALAPPNALAQSPPAAGVEPAPTEAPSALVARAYVAEDAPRLRVLTGEATGLYVGGYVETYYSYNAGRPSNGVSEFRAFDNRHNAVMIQALALDVGWRSPDFEAKLVVQAGMAPATYYGASEPSRAGTALTPATNAGLWRTIQQAWLAWAPVRDVILVDAGLFLSPIGPEGMATYQNYHWSHSLLFYGLPFYHAGARVRWSPSRSHALRAGVYNGWNNASDNNAEKSFGLDYAFTPFDGLAFGAVYFGGVERPSGAAEGRAWRHLLDANVVWSPAAALSLLGNVDVGAEPNDFGLSGWSAVNLSARVRLLDWLFVAARGTLFAERRARRAGVAAAPIAIPASRIASGTLTLEAIPSRGLSFKLEARYDRASSDVYFAGRVEGDGSAATPFVPNAPDQLTTTLGATAWF